MPRIHSRLTLDVATSFLEQLRGLLRQHGIDMEPATRFKSSQVREPRRDLDVPMIAWRRRRIQRGGVDDIIERGLI